MRHIGEVVRQVRKQLLKENTKKALGVGEHWDKIVDAQTASRTCVMGFRQKVLYVKVESAALLNELCNFKKDAILAQLQSKYPDHKIRDIKFTI
jgi:predicted nucleic acid-binding Zn ribbon protein